MNKEARSRCLALVACAAALWLAACGGGSGADSAAAVESASADDGRAGALAAKPVINAQPADATAVAGQAAQFRVVVAGYGNVYQWYRNGRLISGATSDVYVAPKARAGDDGTRYSVVVRGNGGSVRSRSAVLQVSAKPSLLGGRSWVDGDPLESGDESVIDFRSGIDDAGRVTAMFVKNDGVRNVVYAVSGTPGARGKPPAWRSPVKIDMLQDGTVLGPPDTRLRALSLGVSPKGNAFAAWIHTRACDADGYATSNCDYVYGARYLADKRQWESPMPFGSSRSGDRLVARINDVGDVAVLYDGWQSTTFGPVKRPAVAWRAGGGDKVVRQVFQELDPDSFGDVVLDRAGAMTLAANALQRGTSDVVAYRGRVGAQRFGAQTILDRRGMEASFSHLALGLQGQVAVSWRQDNGREETRYVAVRPAGGSAWRVADIGPEFADNGSSSDVAGRLSATDAGDVVWQDLGRCVSKRWSKKGWAAALAMPPECARPYAGEVASNPNADFVALYDEFDNAGAYAAYVADRNTMARTFATSRKGSGYLFGTVTPQALGALAKYRLHLARNGVGALVLKADFDELPTADRPNGDRRRDLHNLWGIYLK